MCPVHGLGCPSRGLSLICREARPDVVAALRRAAGVAPDSLPTPSPAAREHARRTLLLSRAARSCLYREACGCVYAQCHWRDRKVTLQECCECLSG